MNVTPAQIDPAFPAMTMDILSSVLSRAGNPGELGKYLTEEIRELTGAQCVLLVQHLHDADQAGHRIISMNPSRRQDLMESSELPLLIQAVCHSAAPSLWRPDGSDAASAPLRRLGFGLSLAIPLKAGAFKVGAVLALGLPDDLHVGAVLKLLETLAPIVALSLRNSFLYEQQERIIQERTSELRLANQSLRTSLDEKVALLKEVHHRVKNNLQIIISLLNLQGGQIQNAEALNILKTTQMRVRSMALLHETLYRSENLSRVDFAGYLNQITAHLLRSFGSLCSRVKLECHAAGVELGLDQAVPCGLIVNELVCNSMKHAFPAQRAGQITVDMASGEDRRIVLSVADDGIGLPASLDIDKTQSLGLQLVRILTAQIHGTLEIERQNGAVFRIVFQPNAK
jgi:two-component sensor histidine kinase